jgi:hypothetical protein
VNQTPPKSLFVLSCSSWIFGSKTGFLAFGFWLLFFAIGFYNKYLASQHHQMPKKKKNCSQHAFQLLVYFIRNQLSNFSKTSSTSWAVCFSFYLPANRPKWAVWFQLTGPKGQFGSRPHLRGYSQAGQSNPRRSNERLEWMPGPGKGRFSCKKFCKTIL